MAVDNHLVCGTKFDFNVSFFNFVCQTEMTHVKNEVSRLSKCAAGLLAVVLPLKWCVSVGVL